jgi:NADP-dependent 3-hydroxy acid dehydrogenase YdfG/cytochrome c-type biogenesis protein CcmH/NrfG
MNNPYFIISYHSVNQVLADTMIRDLSAGGFTFSTLSEKDLGTGATLAGTLQNEGRPIILMVSDNFLKSEVFIHQLLPFLKSRDQSQIQIILLTEGQADPDTPPSPTRIDRVGQILHYINYWQDRYLHLRKLQSHPETIGSVSEESLTRTRQIAFEIGDLIEYFRENASYAWEAFTANRYELFFRKSGNISLHHEFLKGTLYPDDDRELEEKIRKQLEQLRQQEEQEKQNQESVDPNVEDLLEELAGKTNTVSRQQVDEAPPEKELLSKLIAYKNRLEEPEDMDNEDDDDDWDEDELWDDNEEEETEVKTEIITLQPRNKERLQDLVAKDPDNINALLDLAYLMAEDDQAFNETTGLLEKVLILDPGNPRAFFLLGQLSLEYKEFHLAQRYFERALEGNPNHTESHLQLAKLLMKDPEKLEVALEHLSAARKIDPDNAEIWAQYGYALALNKSLKKAVKAYKKALDLDPENEVYASQLSELYFKTGDKVKALKHHKEKSKSQDPGKIPDQITPTYTATPEDHILLEPIEKPPRKVAVLTVLITGATSGIGRATARYFAERGHRIILTGRREDRLTALQAELEQRFNTAVLPLAFDIRQEAVTRQLIKSLPSPWSNIDVLINNAGLAKGLAPVHEGKIEDWDTMIDTNIKGLLYMTKAVAGGMVQRRKGHIINICSTAGKETYPMGNVYCATKHAVDALTKSFRLDLHGYNIRVGQVSPGHVEETEFALNRFDGDTEKAGIYKDFNPLQASDVAAAIYYMIEQPPHVSIHDIVLTGTQQASSTQINRSGRIFD